MEDRIKKLSKELNGTLEEKAKKIQQMLLWDTNNQVPLQFIIKHMEK